VEWGREKNIASQGKNGLSQGLQSFAEEKLYLTQSPQGFAEKK
jgi:hypothetical protein